MRAPRMEILPVRITSTRGNLLPTHNGRPAGLAGTSSCCGARISPKGKRTTMAKQLELNDLSKFIRLGLLTTHQDYICFSSPFLLDSKFIGINSSFYYNS